MKIYDYEVVCDSTNNTPEDIDQRKLYVDIRLKVAGLDEEEKQKLCKRSDDAPSIEGLV